MRIHIANNCASSHYNLVEHHHNHFRSSQTTNRARGSTKRVTHSHDRKKGESEFNKHPLSLLCPGGGKPEASSPLQAAWGGLHVSTLFLPPHLETVEELRRRETVRRSYCGGRWKEREGKKDEAIDRGGGGGGHPFGSSCPFHQLFCLGDLTWQGGNWVYDEVLRKFTVLGNGLQLIGKTNSMMFRN